MSRVSARDTKPERSVRKILHQSGLRFRLHRGSLPGTPDIVLPRHRTVVFVHGCFWHRHPGCRKASVPKSRTEFWTAKFDRNVQRDLTNTEALAEAGWKVVIIWECEAFDSVVVLGKVNAALQNEGLYRH